MRFLKLAIILGLTILALAGCRNGNGPPTTENGGTPAPSTDEGDTTDTKPTAAGASALESPTPSESAVAEPTIGEDSGSNTRPFTLVSQDPIISAGDGGNWSRPLQNSGAVLYYAGQFHMFRNGYPSLPGNAVIGYATSPDGLHWTHYENNPVLRTEDVPYADQMIMASSVHVEDDGTWVMYFLIWDSPQTPGAIGRATAPSPTGLWTPDANPVLQPGGEGEWDSALVTHPIVFFDETDDSYKMYYTGVDDENVARIGLATSPDGTVWTKLNDPSTSSSPFIDSDPVLQPGLPGEWDEGGAARGRVVRSPDGYIMIYRAPAAGLGYNFGLAFSDDGIEWTKYEDNPILTRDEIPGARGLFFPTFAFHDGTYYFYIEAYSGSSRIFLLTGRAPLFTPGFGEQEEFLSIVNLVAFDRANSGNASDIEVRFDVLQSASQVQEHRVMLVKADQASRFDAAVIANLSPERFAVPPMAGDTISFRLPSDLVDTDGEAIVEGRSYVVFVGSVTNSGVVHSAAAEEIALANEATVWTLLPELPSATGGLAVDAAGNIYAANIGLAPSRNGSEIFRITPEGDYELWVSGQGLLGASGNTFDAQGNLIQSSLRANKIHRITPDGTVSEFASDGLASPVGVTVAADGGLYVANCGNNSILHIAPAGNSEVTASSSGLACPNGITLDEAGNLYVANFSNGNVYEITPTGEVSQFVELPGHNNGHIFYHRGLLYVVSRGGHQIFTVTLDGELSLLAGTGERGHTDGPALEAAFSLPNDIVPSPDGRRLYVNEAFPTSGGANKPSVIRVIELPRED